MRKAIWDVGTFLFSAFFVLMMILLLAGCASVKPCFNVATDNTLYEIGVTTQNRGDFTCSDGLDNDLLDPDIYTGIE